MKKEAGQGWRFPFKSFVAHYFADGVSLCGKWKYYARLEKAREDCVKCPICMRKEAIKNGR